jgi:hypothetical protein
MTLDVTVFFRIWADLISAAQSARKIRFRMNLHIIKEIHTKN